jgi:hypothetical protein
VLALVEKFWSSSSWVLVFATIYRHSLILRWFIPIVLLISMYFVIVQDTHSTVLWKAFRCSYDREFGNLPSVVTVAFTGDGLTVVQNHFLQSLHLDMCPWYAGLTCTLTIIMSIWPFLNTHTISWCTALSLFYQRIPPLRGSEFHWTKHILPIKTQSCYKLLYRTKIPVSLWLQCNLSSE